MSSPSAALPRQDDRTIIVTGANTGIGRVTATELARAGAHVVLACRSEERAAPVIRAIQRAHGEQSASFLALDLASLAHVRDAAKRFLDTGRPLHVLINNAGLAGVHGRTEDGFELTFGVNHLGPFLFTMLLREAMTGRPDARVVNVASRAHQRIDALDLEAVTGATITRTGFPEYCASKLANVLFSSEWARRTAHIEGAPHSYALHPGVVASDVWRHVPWPIRSVMKLFMITNEQGAQTSLHCATSPEVSEDNGLYYVKSRAKRPAALARDTQLARALWDRSLEWTGAPEIAS